MDPNGVLAKAPAELRVATTAGEQAYHLAGDLIAVHVTALADASVVDEDQGIVVQAVHAPLTVQDGDQLGPVYLRDLTEERVIPTGRILVRFPVGDLASRHRADLDHSGYALERTLAYAPHAAWVRLVDGGISESLSCMSRLTNINGIQHVEPQFLSERILR